MKCHAFAMPAALVASALILLLIMSGYSALSLKMQEYASYHRQKQEKLDILSALNRFCRDSLLCPNGEISTMEVFSDNPVNISSQDWGFYKIVSLSSGNNKYFALVGQKDECPAKAAFWSCDMQRPISFAGNTEINGLAYIPASGINYTEILQDYYSGRKLDESQLRLSELSLPQIDCQAITLADSIISLSAQIQPPSYFDNNYHSFANPVIITTAETAPATCLGNIILTGDYVELDNKAIISDIIVSARKVRIKSGFHGRLQIFCSDSVIVDENAILDYPSGIYIHSGRHPYAELKHGSEIYGYVIINSDSYDTSYQSPNYIQDTDSSIYGLLYVTGTSCLMGNIYGAAYINDFFHKTNGHLYPKTLYNTHIERNDSIVFPIFLSGNYRKSIIKKLH